MWMKLGLLSFIAVCLLPDTVISLSDKPTRPRTSKVPRPSGGPRPSSKLEKNFLQLLAYYKYKTELPDQCNKGVYNTLSEVSRSINAGEGKRNCDGYQINNGSPISPCWTGDGWYKFANAAGTKIATSPPPRNHCGTNGTGWMTAAHPSKIGETKKVKFCFNWDDNSCKWTTYGAVTKCGKEDYVYRLPNAPFCALRYCAVP